MAKQHKPGQHDSVQEAARHRSVAKPHSNVQQAAVARFGSGWGIPWYGGSWTLGGTYPRVDPEALPTPSVDPINPL